MRPLLLRGALAFQTEEFTEKQAFQKNQNAEKTAEYLLGELENRYRNAEIASLHGIVNILISKKGTVTIKEKKVGLKERRNILKRVLAKLRIIIDTFNWEYTHNAYERRTATKIAQPALDGCQHPAWQHVGPRFYVFHSRPHQ